MEGAVADALVPACIVEKEFAPLHAHKDWYASWAEDAKPWFQAIQDHSIRPQTGPHWTVTRIRSLCGDKNDKLLGVGSFSSTNFGMGESVKQDPLRCNAGKYKAVLDA